MAFGYGSCNGPHLWATMCQAAGGKRQSPIIINKASATHDASLPPLSVSLSDVAGQVLKCGEHNFQVASGGGGTLSGGPLSAMYKFVQFHFHWGTCDNYGSEHLVDGKSFASELHLVFMNSKYSCFTEALKHEDGLAVLGIFLSVDESAQMEPMEQLCKYLRDAKCGEEKTIEPSLPLQKFLPGDISKFYTYPGSLTTPPCSECVTWLVLAEPIAVTSEMIKSLRGTHSSCQECGCTDNCRQVCPLGGRVVKASFA